MSRLPFRETHNVAHLPDEEDHPWKRWRTFTKISVGLPQPGIYEFAVKGPKTNNGLVVLYVGASKDLNRRHKEYLRGGSHIHNLFQEAKEKGLELWMRYKVLESTADAYVLERRHLYTFNYAWNTQFNHKERPLDEAIKNAKEAPPNTRTALPLITLLEPIEEKIRARYREKKKKAVEKDSEEEEKKDASPGTTKTSEKGHHHAGGKERCVRDMAPEEVAPGKEKTQRTRRNKTVQRKVVSSGGVGCVQPDRDIPV